MNQESLETKGIFYLMLDRPLLDLFRYARRAGLTSNRWPSNDKRYYATLIYRAGRGQHFRDTHKD